MDLADAILAARVLLGMSTLDTAHKEVGVNGAGKIGMVEVIYILQKVAELR